ncbi:MAG: hypothetical protein WKF88_09310 [Ferruginibacter sp.]
MDHQEIIDLYNPANASKLTEEQREEMKNLTDEQIAALAEAYPNKPTGNAYLSYFDKSLKAGETQRYPLGTWQNLNNLRKLKKDMVAFAFTSYMPQRAAAAMQAPSVRAASSRTLDLSKDDLTNAEGFKKADGGDITTETDKEENKDLAVTYPPAGFDNQQQNTGNDSPGGQETGKGENAEKDALVKTYHDLVAELEQAKTDRAHHMTIKNLESKVAGAKEAAGL